MAGRVRANAVLTTVSACACGLAVAVVSVSASPGLGPGWVRLALAQQAADEPGAAEWQRLAGPLPYRPSAPDGGWLTEADIARAADLVADLGLFFAKLSETDPNAGARRIWAQGEDSYGEAADELRAAIADGRFRIVVSEGSRLAVIQRGQEVWIDSDLAGAWDVEQVRRARRTGDDWPDDSGPSWTRWRS